MSHIQYKKIAVIGFGVSGKSIAQYFLKNNVEVDVYEDKNTKEFDTDSVQIFLENKSFRIYFSDSDYSFDISQYDVIVASPGVPLTHKIIIEAQKNNIEYITDINLFVRLFRKKYPQGKIISVTGSNGKSTTVSIMHEGLKAQGLDVYLGGNIGVSPLDFINTIKTNKPYIILETSSYQLEYLKESDYFDVACILNLSDNHLNRYKGSKKLYAKAKLGGIDYQKTITLLNFDDEYTRKYIMTQIKSNTVLGIQFETNDLYDVITFENNKIIYKGEEDFVYVDNVSDIKLIGEHNIYNLAFVCGVMHVLGIMPNKSFQNAINNFSGLIHRIQYVASIKNVIYINDSKSTSPDATIKAIHTISSDNKNIILISGGNDKDISYENMRECWDLYVKSLILLPGDANKKLKDLANKSNVNIVNEVNTMQDAVEAAFKEAKEEDVVLLSPATDSHASFYSFEDRGNQFIQCVQKLKNQ